MEKIKKIIRELYALTRQKYKKTMAFLKEKYRKTRVFKHKPSSGSSGAERRRFVRLSTVFPIDYKIVDKQKETLGKIGKAFTRNVSEGGMCLEVSSLEEDLLKKLESKEAGIALIIEVPFSGKPVKAFGKLVWAKKIKETAPNKFILGIDYEVISDKERKKIIRFARFNLWKPRVIAFGVFILVLALLFSGRKVLLEKKARQEAQKTVAAFQREKFIASRLEELAASRAALQQKLGIIKKEALEIEKTMSELSGAGQDEEKPELWEKLTLKLEDNKKSAVSLESEIEEIIKRENLLTKELAELKGELSEQEELPARVKIAKVIKENFEDTLPSLGTIRGYVEVDLKFGINGTIENFYFKNGEKVEKGQLIANLDQEDARVKHEYAKLKLEEYESLYEIGAIAESKLKQVHLEEELARIEFEKTALKAPFNGVLNNREAERGRFVTINDRVATFSSVDEVVAEVGIIEKDIEKIKLGQRAVIKVDAYPNVEFVGAVDNISSSFEGKSRTLTIRIKIPNLRELLLPGMFARVVVYIYEKKEALIIPLLALNREAGEYQVFVADKEGVARLKKVEVDYISSDKAVIAAGLDAGETVIVEMTKEIKDGDKVEVIEE